MKAASFNQLFHPSRRLLIDANLLFLYFIGLVSRDLIALSKPTRESKFTRDDFELLGRLIHHFGGRVYTTPHILTEVSNLATKLLGHNRLVFLMTLAKHIGPWCEQSIRSQELVALDYFPRFGLTDAAIIRLSSNRMLVLTMDRPLCGYLRSKDIEAMNFRDLQAIVRPIR
ncbi:MAG: PIN domain-containing protein [Limisphaerales bacterium]